MSPRLGPVLLETVAENASSSSTFDAQMTKGPPGRRLTSCYRPGINWTSAHLLWDDSRPLPNVPPVRYSIYPMSEPERIDAGVYEVYEHRGWTVQRSDQPGYGDRWFVFEDPAPFRRWIRRDDGSLHTFSSVADAAAWLDEYLANVSEPGRCNKIGHIVTPDAMTPTVVSTRHARRVHPKRGGLQHSPRAEGTNLPEYLEQRQFAAVIAATPNPVTKLLMLDQRRASLRVSEALALEKRNLFLDSDRTPPRERRGKENKERVAPLHAELQNALTAGTKDGAMQQERLIDVSRTISWR